MPSDTMPKALTPSKVTHTSVPFAVPNLETNAKSSLKQDATKKITVTSSTEFLEYSFPGSIFDAQAHIRFIYDHQNQPMIFSIGSDKNLYVCVNVTGASGGLRSFRITPTDSVAVQAFDIFQKGDNILLVVAGQKQNHTHIHYVTLKAPSLSADSAGAITNNVFTTLSWNSIEKNLSTSSISSLSCALQTVGSGGSASTTTRIVAEVEGTTSTVAAHFMFDSNAPDKWNAVPLPVQGQRVLNCRPVTLPAPLGPGLFYLLESETTQQRACYFQGGKNLHIPMQFMLHTNQKPQGISCSLTSMKTTDVVVATDSGLAFYNSQRLNPDTTPNDVLGGDISFREAFCEKEVESKESPNPGWEHWSVFAVSSHDELYFFEGTRKPTDQAILWSQPLVPLRTGVRHIAGQLNPGSLVPELVLVMKQENAISHLSRSPTTYLWNEKPLISTQLGSTKVSMTKTHAFVITVAFTDGQGTAVPAGYPVGITSDPLFAIINGLSYNIDHKPQTIATNEFGRIVIAIATDGKSLVASDLDISLSQFVSKPEKVSIQPAQRALHMMSQIKSGDDLRTLKNKNGELLFKDTKSSSFDDAANMLGQLPASLGKQSSASSTNSAIKSSAPLVAEDIVICYERNSNGTKQSTESSWLSDAMDAAGSVLGEIMEFLKKAVKAVVKVALKIVGPVITFIIKIAGRVLRFALDAVGKIMTCVLDLLQAILPWDLSAIRDWFTFRYKKVEETRQDLQIIFNAGLKLSSRFMKENQEAVRMRLDDFQTNIASFLGVESNAKGSSSDSQHSEGGLLDNPVIVALLKFNPLSWILEAVTEELGSSMPPFAFVSPVPSLAESAGEVLSSFLNHALDGAKQAISDPSSAGNTIKNIIKGSLMDIFAGIKAIILAVLNTATHSIDAVITFLNAKWNFGDLSDLWKEFTDCDFTILNFVTYVLAQLMELLNFTKEAALKKVNVRTLLKDVDTIQLPTLATLLDGSNATTRSRRMGDSSITPKMDMLTKKSLQMEEGLMQHRVQSAASVPRHLDKATTGGSDSAATTHHTPNHTAEAFISLMRFFKSFGQCMAILAEGTLEQIEHAGQADVGGVKGMMFGINVTSFALSVVEYCLIDHYLSDEEKEKEGFAYLKFEFIASLLRVFTSPMGSKALAVGNTLVSVSAFVRALMIPERHVTEYAEMVGSGAAVLATIGFTLHVPYMGWGCWFVDLGSTVTIFGAEYEEFHTKLMLA